MILVPRTHILRLLLLAVTWSLTLTPASAMTRNEIKDEIRSASLQSGLPPSLGLAVAMVGSDFQPQVLSQSGARGIMQLYPDTLEGVDAEALSHPKENIRRGIDYLNRLVERYFGQWELALSHYHSGYPVTAPLMRDLEPGSEAFVDQVLQWEARYRAQKALWHDQTKPDTESESADWRLQAPINSPSPTMNETFPIRGDIEQRRLEAQRTLDDFGYRGPTSLEPKP